MDGPADGGEGGGGGGGLEGEAEDELVGTRRRAREEVGEEGEGF